ncbi:MAG: ATP-binding cassette domain-containing protein [Thermoleophilaceae bacterium]
MSAVPPDTQQATRLVSGKGRTARFLSRTLLLRNASPEVIERVAQALRPRSVRASNVIAHEGDQVDAFYLVEAGTFTVSLSFGGTEREVARVGPGEFFGELALLGESGKMATVRAVTDAQLQVVSAEEFRAIIADVPELAEMVRRVAAERKAKALRTAFELEDWNVAGLLEQKSELSLGRAPENDLVFDSPTVSRRHALIRIDGGRCTLTDLNSTAGTFVNGNSVRGSVEIVDGDEILLGDQRFTFDRGGEAVQVASGAGIRVDVIDVRKELKDGRSLLQDVSLSILPGEFVAIVGGSGAGKTTLMDVMSGVRPATSGQVLYNGRDYYQDVDQYRHTLGYVPQDDILHTEMPLGLTLRYAGKLRLPRDTSDEAIDQAVDRSLSQLGLSARKDVPVALLSGGQRKRASIGIELLTEPRIFFLDEPTSGLDPGTETQMMRLLRELADDGRTVVLTTHATQNVTLCDRIVVLARDGNLAYTGPPEGALAYFEVQGFDEIYTRLEEGQPQEWAQYFRASPAYEQVESDRAMAASAPSGAAEGHGLARPPSRGLRHQLHQFKVLSRRHFDLYARHPVNFMPLVMQPIVFTVLLLALFRGGVFDEGSDNPSAAFQLVYMFAFMVFLYGLLFGAQEIVKERAIFFRERLVGVGVVPYLMSKTSFLAPLLVLCGCVMTFLLWITNRLPDEGLDFYGPLIITLVITSWAGLALSLFISSVANNSQQSTDMLTPAIAPQVLFAGALLAVPAMNSIGQVVAAITGVRWSLEALVQATDLKELWATSDTEIGRALLVQYEDSFNSDLWIYWLILSAFVLVPLVAATLVLRKKTQPK